LRPLVDAAQVIAAIEWVLAEAEVASRA